MNHRQIAAYQQQAIDAAIWDARQLPPTAFAWLEPSVAKVGLSVNK